MNEYQFAFRSITKAQQAAHAMKVAGIPAAVHRTQGACAGQSCGYSVFVAAGDRQAAWAVLDRQGILPDRACGEDGRP